MFTFIKVSYETEVYLEDYGIYYADTMKRFMTYNMSIAPIISINREDYTIELYDFVYKDILPSDKPKLIKAIIQLVELKDELNINNYMVIGEGADLYRKLFNRPFI